MLTISLKDFGTTRSKSSNHLLHSQDWEHRGFEDEWCCVTIANFIFFFKVSLGLKRLQRNMKLSAMTRPSQRTLDCLQSAFSLKIRLVLISFSAISSRAYALVSRGSRFCRSRPWVLRAVTLHRKIKDCSQSKEHRWRRMMLCYQSQCQLLVVSSMS